MLVFRGKPSFSFSPNPTLAYLYRRFLANRLVDGLAPGRFLEVGVGRGRFFEDLVAHGFHGLCLDLNPVLIRELEADPGLKAWPVQFKAQDFFELDEQFELIVAFEVLEHYEQDSECLQKWKKLLASHGELILSVPAHMSQWTQNDSNAGHARRYEKEELAYKLRASGFRIDALLCYGFPLLNFTYPLSSGARREPTRSILTGAEDPRMADWQKTAQSGDRSYAGLSSWLFCELVWFPWLHAQRPFLSGDLGTGYIVRCTATQA
ncbi:MAG: class I SAM-dependent methyltransferase [Acidimicrobiia bacterium]|nr:class I SAM-dependent methyltransferase [Acidimicrobiia bacterium]